MLDIEKHIDILPPITVAIYELGLWCFESLFAQQRIPTTEDSRHHVKTLPRRYISGVSQWGDIKTDRAFIHANRMWIALRLVVMIQQFVDSIKSQGDNARAQGGTESAMSKGFRHGSKIMLCPTNCVSSRRNLGLPMAKLKN